MYYVFIDEIQKAFIVNNLYVDDANEKISFVDTILGLQKLKIRMCISQVAILKCFHWIY